MKAGDKVRIVITWDTGDLFGVLKGEKEYTLGSVEEVPLRQFTMTAGNMGSAATTVTAPVQPAKLK